MPMCFRLTREEAIQLRDLFQSEIDAYRQAVRPLASALDDAIGAVKRFGTNCYDELYIDDEAPYALMFFRDFRDYYSGVRSEISTIPLRFRFSTFEEVPPEFKTGRQTKKLRKQIKDALELREKFLQIALPLHAELFDQGIGLTCPLSRWEVTYSVEEVPEDHRTKVLTPGMGAEDVEASGVALAPAEPK